MGWRTFVLAALLTVLGCAGTTSTATDAMDDGVVEVLEDVADGTDVPVDIPEEDIPDVPVIPDIPEEDIPVIPDIPDVPKDDVPEEDIPVIPDIPDVPKDDVPEEDIPDVPEEDAAPPVTGDALVVGELKQWHALAFLFTGPSHAETDTAPNPFLDYRFTMTFTAPSGTSVVVPGFFSGNGAGEAGARWQVRFRADEVGQWSYLARFVQGPNVAIDLAPEAGTPTAFDGGAGTFMIQETDKAAPDFRATGRIVYADSHYLRTQDGARWIKGGADSPENFLGYAGFDNTVDQPNGVNTAGLNNGVHEYGPHEKDWSPGDPDWGNEAGRGIIGALNYLGSQHVNSIYFLPCNLGGDGRETYPYVQPDDLLHFDLSKIDQWEVVFSHAQTLGIALHVVLNETESGNENLHDNGTLGVQRKLYYRELVARFAHHPGLFWNIGEENDYGDTKQKAFATYLRAQDPFDHPTTVHTNVNKAAQQYDGLVGNPNFEMTSLQLKPPTNANSFTETWRTESANAGRPWAVMVDEIGPAGTGVTDTNAPQIRRETLWPAYLSGAAGVEWYFGYHSLPLGGDMRCEDFRTREPMWKATWIARQFLTDLPLETMVPSDGLLGGQNGQVFAKAGEVFAVYLPNGGEATVDLSGETGNWGLRWYNVTDGTWSTTYGVTAPGVVSLGTPAFSGDVAAVLVAGETGPPAP